MRNMVDNYIPKCWPVCIISVCKTEAEERREKGKRKMNMDYGKRTGKSGLER